MKTRHINIIFAAILVFTVVLGFAASLQAGDTAPIKPGPRDKCPVCGMFVAKYPDFITIMTFRDESYVFFDGVKDMMKYYFSTQKYTPGKTSEDIATIHVTDYYTMNPVDGFKAVYVSGSDVFGPMGRELIPFEKKEDAAEFKEDHHGKAVYGFHDITDDIVKSLDR